MEYRERPENLTGITYKVKTGCGSLFVTVNVDESNKPFEVFAMLSKSGVCAKSVTEGLARLTTLYLRSGGDLTPIIKHLQGISCLSQAFDANYGKNILSCSDGIATALNKHISSKDIKEEIKSEQNG